MKRQWVRRSEMRAAEKEAVGCKRYLRTSRQKMLGHKAQLRHLEGSAAKLKAALNKAGGTITVDIKGKLGK